MAVDDAKVQRAVANLTDDFYRQSEYLAFADLARTVSRRGLNGRETELVRERLAAAGIVVTEESEQAQDASGDGEHIADLLELFAHEMRKVPLLSFEEECMLGEAALAYRTQVDLSPDDVSEEVRLRAERARNKLVSANLRFVVRTAHEYRWCGIDVLDLVEEGVVGLIRGAEKYDPAFGVRFMTYAAHWVHQAILKAIADQSGFTRIPPKVLSELTKMKRVTGALIEEKGSAPLSEIALHLGVREDRGASSGSDPKSELNFLVPSSVLRSDLELPTS